MSKFLREKKLLIKEIIYKKGLFSDLKEEKNCDLIEQKMDSLSTKATCNSVNMLIRYLKQNSGYDLIETGTIKIKNIEELENLISFGKIICELDVTLSFLNIPFQLNSFMTSDRKLHYLSQKIRKNIIYYEKNKKFLCYIY